MAHVGAHLAARRSTDSSIFSANPSARSHALYRHRQPAADLPELPGESGRNVGWSDDTHGEFPMAAVTAVRTPGARGLQQPDGDCARPGVAASSSSR